MASNTLYLFVGALVAGLIGTGIWAYQAPPGIDIAPALQGLVMAKH